MKPIEGMKQDPAGLPLMFDAWLGLLIWASSQEQFTKAFKEDTGYDLLQLLNQRGINKMINEATGYDRSVIVEWADWVTLNLWGEL